MKKYVNLDMMGEGDKYIVKIVWLLEVVKTVLQILKST